MSIRRALVFLFALLLVAAPSASAGSPGKWTQVGQRNLANIDEVALARTADGTLHAVWTVPAPNSDSLVHAAISKAGGVLPPDVIQSGWAGIEPVPDLVATSSGLRVFFGGLRTTNSTEPNQWLNTATAPVGGSPWDLFVGAVAMGDASYAGDSGDALLADGTPLLSWGGTGSGVYIHRGLDPNTPNFPLQPQLGGCCGYSPDIAVDTSTGSPVIAWVSNATGNIGVFTQTLDPNTGAPEGTPSKMPGSSTVFNGQDSMNQQLQRISIVARPGGGVYTVYPEGYPTTSKVVLWRVGTPRTVAIATSKFDHFASVAADADGRLWVAWVERSTGRHQVFARRSNKAGTDFGPAVKVKAPPGETTAYKIDANAQTGGPLDVIVLWGSVTPQQAQYHTQILPGLDLTASPAKLSKKKSTTVKFTVRDPDAVKGAKVSAGGKSATTDNKGHATITLGPSKKSLAATAKKTGYTSATKKLKTH